MHELLRVEVHRKYADRADTSRDAGMDRTFATRFNTRLIPLCTISRMPVPLLRAARPALAHTVLMHTALLFAASAICAQAAPPKPATPQTITELEARIRFVLDSAKVPGMGLAIVRHDSIVYTGGFGKARLSPPLAATDSTLFRIGSTSKAFVALTVMALVREGKMSLDDKLSDRLPGFYYRNPWEATDPIRVKHLLEHTSGFDDNSLMGYSTNIPELTLAQGLQLDSATHVSRWRPGTHMSYCNSGPAIVALMIERIEGKPFEQVVQERWFNPIGMRTATYMRPDTTTLSVASLYAGNPPVVQPYWYVFIRPAGSINANAHDMGAYVRFLLGRGTVNGVELLPASLLERMEHSQTTTAARAGLTPGYGLHLWRAADTTGFTWTQHNGGVNGGLSDMSYLPDQGVGYAFQINNGDGSALRQITKAVRAFVTRGLTPNSPELPVVAVEPRTRAEFAGWYRPLSPRVEHLVGVESIVGIVHVTFSDSGLAVKPLFDKGNRFVAVDSMRFRRRGEREATLALVRDDANERAQGMEDVTSGLATSFGRVSAIRALGSVAIAVLGLGGLVLAIVAMGWGLLRRVVARVRKQAISAAPMRRAWRALAMLGVIGGAWLLLLATASEDLQTIGHFNATTATIWSLGYLFVLGTALAPFFTWRGDSLISATHTGTWHALSRWTARSVMVCAVICAGYLLSSGLIGWKTWAA